MVRRLARWLGATVIAIGLLGGPEGLGTSASADTVKLRAAKKQPTSKARAKKSSKKKRSKQQKKKTKSKPAKRASTAVKRPMP